MKRVLVGIMMCGCLAGEENGPVPIPAERREEISQKMLAAQAAQIAVARAQVEFEKAAKAAEETMAAYERLRTALQKEFHAEGCDLSFEKTWVRCPEHK